MSALIDLICRLRVKGGSHSGPNIYDDAADGILALDAALKEMLASCGPYRPENSLDRPMWDSRYIVATDRARRLLMLACQHDLQKPGCTVIVSQEKDHQGAVCIECGNTWTNPPYGVLATVKIEPVAYLKEWNADDGKPPLRRRRVDMHPELDPWMELPYLGAVVTPLYRTAKIESVKDDPNAPFRWICTHCNTVSAAINSVCVGCGQPRYPLLAELRKSAQ